MAQATSHDDTHSTTAQGGWSTKTIAVTALFCALAAVCTLFIEIPLLPGVPWLQYDPSGIVALVAGFAFGPAALHRVEANVMPRNTASLRVLEKCGYRPEGLARRYLRINGVWEDHIHMVRLNEPDKG